MSAVPDTTACEFCGRDRLDPTWKHKGETVRVGAGGTARTCFKLSEHTHPPVETDCPKELPRLGRARGEG